MDPRQDDEHVHHPNAITKYEYAIIRPDGKTVTRHPFARGEDLQKTFVDILDPTGKSTMVAMEVSIPTFHY